MPFRCHLALSSLLPLVAAERAAAFCDLYVAGADSRHHGGAERDGTRTVLSMQNNYDGPPEDFALVIPVPSVLTKEQVKVLPKAVFGRVDTLGAPRLVEYWEVDPGAHRNGAKSW